MKILHRDESLDLVAVCHSVENFWSRCRGLLLPRDTALSA